MLPTIDESHKVGTPGPGYGKFLDDLNHESHDSCIRGLILYFKNLTQPLKFFSLANLTELMTLLSITLA